MSYGQGWTPPPPPPAGPGYGPPQHGEQPPRRYATTWIWVGIAAGVAVTTGFTFLGLLLATTVQQAAAASAALLIAVIAPLAVGTVFAARQGTPARRGFGLGMIIGWAIAPIVFAGVCFLVIIGASTIPNLGS